MYIPKNNYNDNKSYINKISTNVYPNETITTIHTSTKKEQQS